MRLMAKVSMMLAGALGVACTLGAILTDRDLFKFETITNKTTVACTFIALFIFTGVVIFMFISLCCSCGNVTVIIFGLFTGFATCVFAIIGFCAFHGAGIEAKLRVPTVAEWLFGAITTGFGLLLISMALIATENKEYGSQDLA